MGLFTRGDRGGPNFTQCRENMGHSFRLEPSPTKQSVEFITLYTRRVPSTLSPVSTVQSQNTVTAHSSGEQLLSLRLEICVTVGE